MKRLEIAHALKVHVGKRLTNEQAWNRFVAKMGVKRAARYKAFDYDPKTGYGAAI
jgi:hypothetical protein